MTQYRWPTWADIIGEEIPEFYNYGRSGAGNFYIACQVAEQNVRHQFNEDDLILIMWSNPTREDRYLNKDWLVPGNIFTQETYSFNFVEKFSDCRGYLIQSLAMVELTQRTLQGLSCDYLMTKMTDFTPPNEDLGAHQKYYDKYPNRVEYEDVVEHYKETLAKIKPSIFEIECEGLWPRVKIKMPWGSTTDYHPTPEMHYSFLQKLLPNMNFSSETEKFVIRWQDRLDKAEKIEELHWETWDTGRRL